jgi:transcriptional regulator with XRE-family HTH domain
MDIISSIRREALNQRISITEIAKRLGMSQASLSQMLKADSIKFSVVQRIADILNVSISHLLGENSNTEEKNPTTEDRLLSIIESQQRTIESLTSK